MSRRPDPLDETRADEIRRDVDLEAEFGAHIAHRVDDLMAAGVPEDEARARARAEFGDVARLKAEAHASHPAPERRRGPLPALERTLLDLRYALRQLVRNPGFTLVALLTLAIGIGATSTIASVVRAVVFEPLPFDDPDRLVLAVSVTARGDRFSVAEPAFLDWRQQTTSFAGFAASYTRGGILTRSGEPRSVSVSYTTESLLDVLGVPPALGRDLAPEDDVSGSEAPVVLLSHRAWTTDFGADPAIVGTDVELDGDHLQIIGVMPEGLDVLTGDADLFVPLGPDPLMDRDEHYLEVVARLAPGVSMETADAELARLQLELGQRHAVDVGWSARLLEVKPELIGETTIRAGWILLTAAGLLLAMACANVANLLLARAAGRRGEMGLRAALGAGRTRLARQLFTESAVLAVAGGLLGLGLAALALPVVKSMGAAQVPRLDEASLDGAALLACLLGTGAATVVFGLAPGLHLLRSPARMLGGTPRGGTDSGTRTRSLLVGAQVAMTVVLLLGSGLLFRSFVNLVRVDPGFDAARTLAVRLYMPDGHWGWQERAELVPRLREAVAAVPGVRAVGGTAVDPFSGWNLGNFVAPEDRLPDRAADFTPVAWRSVTPGFFEAMGIEVRAGRTFREGDDHDGETRVVIGERLARVAWGDADPIGRVLVWGDPDGTRMRVIGVVEDLRDVELGADPPAIVYRSYREIPWPTLTLVTRIDAEPSAVAAAILARLREVAPGVPTPEIRSLETYLDRAVVEPRFNLALLSAFALTGLLLAVVGLYGLTAFEVRRRSREIGIRLSLGATTDEIRLMVLRRRLSLTVAGALLGSGVAWALGRWLESLLFGVTPADPLTWAGVLALVIATCAGAAWLPTRAALRVDLREVLGGE
jgi:predicted permease